MTLNNPEKKKQFRSFTNKHKYKQAEAYLGICLSPLTNIVAKYYAKINIQSAEWKVCSNN
jgi:hypothetical protein